MKPADQMKVIVLSFFSLAILIGIITAVSITTNKMMAGHAKGAHGTESNQSSSHATKTEEHAAPKTEEHAAPKTEEHATPKTEEHAAPKTEEHAAPKTEEHAAPKTEEHAATKTAASGDAKAGVQVFKTKTCTTCHAVSSVEGAVGAIGPKLDGLGKTAATRVAGKDAVAYIKESIENPTAFVVNGFTPSMPPLKSTMSDKEYEDLVAFLVSL
jgi:cytochrome c2